MKNAFKLFFLFALLLISGNVLAAVQSNGYSVLNPKIQNTAAGTIISGNVSSASNLLGSDFSLKIYSKQNQTGYITAYGGKIGPNGSFSVLMPNIQIKENYNFSILLQKGGYQPTAVVKGPEIVNVYFTKLPRHAAEGVYAGESITLSWSSREIPEDATTTILFYPIDENKKKGAPVIIDNNVLNTGEKTFIVPQGLLRTTEPDYKPYVVTVMYNKDPRISKSTNGYIYIKHNGCPVFSPEPIAFENESYIQKLKVIDWMDVATGTIGVKIYETENGAKKRDPIEGDGKNRISVNKSQSEITIKTSSSLKPSTEYYIYMTGYFWDKNNNLVRSVCVIKREYFTTPSDLYRGQTPRIEVQLPKEAASGKMPLMKPSEYITVKWKTYGLPPGGTVNIELRDNTSVGPINRQEKRLGDLPPLFQKRGIPNTGEYQIKRSDFSKDANNSPDNKQVAIHIHHSYSLGGNTIGTASGRSPMFEIGDNPCPTIEVVGIDPRYYGINVLFKILDWKGNQKLDFYLNNKRSNFGFDDFGEKEEYNPVERIVNGKVVGYDEGGFDSPIMTADTNFYQSGKIYTLKYPAESAENYYQMFKKYPEKIFYLSGRKPYYAVVKISGSNCVIAGFYYVSLSNTGGPVSVQDYNYSILDQNSATITGKVTSQGYSINGAVPYVDIANNAKELGDGNGLVFYTNSDNPSLPATVLKDQEFLIRASDPSLNLDTNNAVYQMCASDNGDGFVDKYMEASARYQSEKTQMTIQNQWPQLRKRCLPFRQMKYSLPSNGLQ